MIVFAWILWISFIVYFAIIFICCVSAFIAYGSGKDVELEYSKIGILFMVATFIFLTLYIFMR